MPSVMIQHQADTPPRELHQLDERTESRLREAVAPTPPIAAVPTPAPVQTLRRTGARPVLFNGVTMATVCGVTPDLPFWYEINVHRTVIDTYLTDIRLFHKAPDAADLFRVAEHDDLDDALDHIERHDAACDVLPGQEFTRTDVSAAGLALAAARLQIRLDQMVGHYRSLSGEILGALAPRA